jgi:hypothetical protein
MTGVRTRPGRCAAFDAPLSVVRGRISTVRQSRIVRRWAGVPAPAAAVGVLICVVLTYGRAAVVVIAVLAAAMVGAAPWLWRRG